MTNRLLVTIAIVYALLLIGLIARQGELLALSIPFLLYLLVGLWNAPSEINLAAARQLSRASASSGEPVECRLLVQNQGSPLSNLQLSDELFPSMQIRDG